MEDDNWEDTIVSKRSIFDINIREIFKYKDLLFMFIKRDFITFYKQTILGPIWFFVQPIITTIIYVVVFGNLAGLSTDGFPKILFYLSGVLLWNYFSDCFSSNSKVFLENQNIFGKVYFPRLIKPLSIIVSNLIKFTIQFFLFIAILLYFIWFKDLEIKINLEFLIFPILILLTASFGLGLGLIVSSLTIKYRDLIFLLQFAIQMFMYATPVVYPLSSLPEKYRVLMNFNPLSGILESFRFIFLNSSNDHFPWQSLWYSIIIIPIILFLGIIVFNKTEKNFMDTI